MKEEIRLYYYERPGDVRCVAIVKNQRIELHGDSKEEVRQKMIAKVRRHLSDNADSVEDVEVEF